MTRLTRAKQLTRSSFVGLGLLVVVAIIGRLLWGLIDQTFISGPAQARANRPNVAYGKLDAPKLQPAAINATQSTLKLDLVNSHFPQTSGSAKVFKVADPSLSLSAQDRARSRAEGLGFNKTSYTQPDPSTFSWNDGVRTFSVNLKTLNFTLRTNLAQIDLSTRQTFTQFSPIADLTGSFLQQYVKADDLQYNAPEVHFANPLGDTFLAQPEAATEITRYAQATFYRQPVDTIPFYATSGKTGPISMVIMPAKRTPSSTSEGLAVDQIVQFTSSYYPIEQSKPAVYPITTAEAAYAALNDHFAQYLVNVAPTNARTLPTQMMSASILYVRLCYLEPDDRNNQYVQPAWMFEGRAQTDAGEARWVAYVPAIDQTATAKLLADQGK